MIQGTIVDRPWGVTLGTFARRGVTGRLTIAGGPEFIFERGHVIGSRDPHNPTSSDPSLRRRETIARMAATFELEHGEFTFEEGVTHTSIPHPPIHIGGLIHRGAKHHMQARIAAEVQSLGGQFALRAASVDDLAFFGFGDTELAVVRALATGVTVPDLDAQPERVAAYAAIYTLASLGLVACAPHPRMARGTRTPPPLGPRMPRASQPPPTQRYTDPAVPSPNAAAEAFRLGQAALQSERFEEAIHEIGRAVALAPHMLDYRCTLAWVQFCAAPDKGHVANSVRTIMHHTILHSERPVQAHYYLGVLERVLGRPQRALEHFERAIELDPTHHDSLTELRFLRSSRH